jgi:hypothetical protein
MRRTSRHLSNDEWAAHAGAVRRAAGEAGEQHRDKDRGDAFGTKGGQFMQTIREHS